MLIINRLPEGAYTGNRRVMKREKVRAEELDFIYTDDKDTCQFLPLIEKPVGDVTYEQCLAVRFYGDVYMGTAQRNYYADRYHEICLCAHYNRRIPGKYEFEEGYQFFVTKKRMCLDIYWNLGNISNTHSVLEHYHSIESAVNSNYYRDFCDLKSQIEEGVKRKKARAVNMFEEDVGISFHPVEDVNGKSRYIMCEIPIIERKEFVQFYLSKGTQSWDRMSISPEPISEMMSFFKDFDELDKKVLHLRKYRLLRSLDPEKDKDLLIAFEKIKKCYEGLKESYMGLF